MSKDVELSAKVVVVGAGVVGTATGQGLSRHGHEVSFVDNNHDRIRALRDMGLSATTDINLTGPSTFVFLTLPTPAKVDQGWDLSYLSAGVTAVGAALREATSPHIVVVRSTVPPRTSDELVVPLLEQHSEKSLGRGFTVASAPEFLRANSALEDFISPWMTVLASRDAASLDRLVKLFRPFGGELRTFDDPVIAEMIKIAHNAFNATKISFWNQMWQLSQELQIDADAVATTVAYSAEGSTNPLYGIRGGFPFRGACLPKDVEGLLGIGRDLSVELSLMRAVRQVNDVMAEFEKLPVDEISDVSVRNCSNETSKGATARD